MAKAKKKTDEIGKFIRVTDANEVARIKWCVGQDCDAYELPDLPEAIEFMKADVIYLISVAEVDALLNRVGADIVSYVGLRQEQAMSELAGSDIQAQSIPAGEKLTNAINHNLEEGQDFIDTFLLALTRGAEDNSGNTILASRFHYSAAREVIDNGVSTDCNKSDDRVVIAEYAMVKFGIIPPPK